MTSPLEAIANATEEAASVFRTLNSVETLGTLSMTEGVKIAGLFAALGDDDTARHIIREVWEGETEDCRDPLPWVNGHGSRRDEETHKADAERGNHEGDERFHFEPRLDWEDAEDAQAYWDARICANCGAYQGPFMPQRDGRVHCHSCAGRA